MSYSVERGRCRAPSAIAAVFETVGAHRPATAADECRDGGRERLIQARRHFRGGLVGLISMREGSEREGNRTSCITSSAMSSG